MRAAGCDLLTLGQYLQPTLKHLPVVEFVPPEKFAVYGDERGKMGFVHVASGPMVRSSYHADEFTLPRPDESGVLSGHVNDHSDDEHRENHCQQRSDKF